MASCSSPPSPPGTERSWSQSPLATKHPLDHHPLQPLGTPQSLSPQATEHVLTAVPPDTKCPPSHGPLWPLSTPVTGWDRVQDKEHGHTPACTALASGPSRGSWHSRSG